MVEEDKTFSRHRLASALLRLFGNRLDVYAVQQQNGYLKVEEPLAREVIEKHLRGEITVGVYQLNRANIVKWLCWDLDPEKLEDPAATAKAIIRESVLKARFYKRSVLLEASRYPDPSYHIWAFFEPLPVPAKGARWIGLKILEHANINPKLVEVFPKQTELTKDRPYGSLVKLPLGLHRKAKKWSYFLTLKTFKPLPKSCIFDVEGVSFSEADLARICSFQQRKDVQIRFNVPENYKPLDIKEEEKVVEFLAKYWHKPTPTEPGNRNRLEMAFLGYCIKRGVSFKSAFRIVDKVTQITADEEREQRLQLVKYHYKNRRNIGSQLLGVSGLREIVQERFKNG